MGKCFHFFANCLLSIYLYYAIHFLPRVSGMGVELLIFTCMYELYWPVQFLLMLLMAYFKPCLLPFILPSRHGSRTRAAESCDVSRAGPIGCRTMNKHDIQGADLPNLLMSSPLHPQQGAAKSALPLGHYPYSIIKCGEGLFNVVCWCVFSFYCKIRFPTKLSLTTGPPAGGLPGHCLFDANIPLRCILVQSIAIYTVHQKQMSFKLQSGVEY